MRSLRLLLLCALAATFVAGCTSLLLDLGGDGRDDDDAGDDDTGDDPADDDDTGDDDTGDDDTIEGPALQVAPAFWQFEDREVGCVQQVTVLLTAVGTEEVVLEGLDFTPGSDDLRYEGPELPTTIESGDAAEVTVFYQPRDESPDAAFLTVTSNAPDDGEAIFTGMAHYADEAVQTFEVEGTGLSDVLWVIDNSCSGEALQQQLAANAAAFVDELVALGVDYHLAVVTTDDGLFQGPEPIISTASSDSTSLFAEAVAVGTAGAGTEQGLRYAAEALTPPLAVPGGANDGFLRPAAALRVVFLSDQDDQSPDAVAAYVETLQAVKDSPAQVTLHALTALPAPRYEQAVAMSGGVTVDVVTEDWVARLGELAQLSAHWIDTFVLDGLPVEEGIEVDLDGVPVHEGWSFDPDLNAVVFEFPYVPDDGDVVTVRYPVIGGC
jgi:hypothetical protein